MSDEMRAYICDTRGFVNVDRYNKYAKMMPQHAVMRVNSLKPLEAKQRTLGAWTLLLETLKTCEDTRFLKLSPERFANLKFGTNDFGKPYLINYSWIHFNLSHSGDYAMCVLSNTDVGCDIQRVEKLNEKVATRFFTPRERSLIEKPGDFARIWARKEAVMKMTGKGFSEGIESFDVTTDEVTLADGTVCYVRDFAIRDEYKCAISSPWNSFPDSIWRVVLI